jgi:hypothetical protein
MRLFEQLQERKAKGERLDFATITPEELTQLYLQDEHIDSQIAALYDVTKNQVKYKRQKFDIKLGLSSYFQSDEFKDKKDQFEREMDKYYRQKHEKSTTPIR